MGIYKESLHRILLLGPSLHLEKMQIILSTAYQDENKKNLCQSGK